MKRCLECGQRKPAGEFYPHQQMRDGLLNHCKPCVRGRVTRHRRENVERIRSYDRGRGFRGRPGNPYRTPEQVSAHNKVRWAIKTGKLLRPDACEKCGQEHSHIHGHHQDYGAPLEVQWLCPPCHAVADGRTHV